MGSAISTPTFQAVANNIKGSTTGTAPAAGYLGEKIDSLAIVGTIAGTSDTTVKTTGGTNAAKLSLTAGTWEIKYGLTGYYSTGSNLNDRGYLLVRLQVDGGAVVPNTLTSIGAITRAAAANYNSTSIYASAVVTITSPTDYVITLKRVDQDGTGSAAIEVTTNVREASFYAVRIA